MIRNVLIGSVLVLAMTSPSCGGQVDPGEPNGNPTRHDPAVKPEPTQNRRRPSLYLEVWWSPDPKTRPVEIDWTATGTRGGSLDLYKKGWRKIIRHWPGGDAVILTRRLEPGAIHCRVQWGDVLDEDESVGLGGPARCEIHTVGDQSGKA
jgi:hypothetical protein